MKSYIIHFIRHGSIDDTLAGKYIGTTDAPLSDRGSEMAHDLGITVTANSKWQNGFEKTRL